jgi:hypothetical protein
VSFVTHAHWRAAVVWRTAPSEDGTCVEGACHSVSVHAMSVCVWLCMRVRSVVSGVWCALGSAIRSSRLEMDARELEVAGQKINFRQDHAHTTNDIPTCGARAN